MFKLYGFIGANTILDGKTQTVYTTTSDKTTHFMSPIGSLQLTAEECNEILMKRAVAAVHNQQTITTTSSDVHNARKTSFILIYLILDKKCQIHLLFISFL